MRPTGQVVDPVENGRQVTGRELSLHAARKGMYAAKQINLVQKQGERRLERMVSDEKQFQSALEKVRSEREKMKDELTKLLDR